MGTAPIGLKDVTRATRRHCGHFQGRKTQSRDRPSTKLFLWNMYKCFEARPNSETILIECANNRGSARGLCGPQVPFSHVHIYFTLRYQSNICPGVKLYEYPDRSGTPHKANSSKVPFWSPHLLPSSSQLRDQVHHLVYHVSRDLSYFVYRLCPYLRYVRLLTYRYPHIERRIKGRELPYVEEIPVT